MRWRERRAVLISPCVAANPLWPVGVTQEPVPASVMQGGCPRRVGCFQTGRGWRRGLLPRNRPAPPSPLGLPPRNDHAPPWPGLISPGNGPIPPRNGRHLPRNHVAPPRRGRNPPGKILNIPRFGDIELCLPITCNLPFGSSLISVEWRSGQPAGRKRIAQRFIAGLGVGSQKVPQGRKNPPLGLGSGRA